MSSTYGLQTLTFELVKKANPDIKADIIMWSAFYEHRIRLGSVSLMYYVLCGPRSNSDIEGYIPSRSLCRQIYETS
jgi:replication factor C subunit 3/5